MPRGRKGTGPFSKAPLRMEQPTERAAPQAADKPAPPSLDIDDRRPLGSVDVDGLSGDVLKRYARRAGVSQRDVDGLTEDRLRQNVKLTIANHFDLLTAD